LKLEEKEVWCAEDDFVIIVYGYSKQDLGRCQIISDEVAIRRALNAEERRQSFFPDPEPQNTKIKTVTRSLRMGTSL